MFAVSASVLVMLCMGFAAAVAGASGTPGVGWSIHSVAEPTSVNAADVQDNTWELVVVGTEGHYKLHPSSLENAEVTVPIEWDAPASKGEEVLGGPESIEKALEALPGIGAGNVEVSGGPGDASASKPYRITWVGALTGSGLGFLNVEEAELKDGGAGGSATSNQIAESSTLDRVVVSVVNVGSRPSEGAVAIADVLPSGLVMVGEPEVQEPGVKHVLGKCVPAEPKCTYSKVVLPGRELVMRFGVAVTSPALRGVLVNGASVSGGGGGEASAGASIPVNVSSMPFGVSGFTFEADGVGGSSDLQAGDHPYGMSTTFYLNSTLERAGKPEVVQDVKDVAVELPLGFAGDPLAAPQCPEVDLTDSEGASDTNGFHTACPAASRVGTISLVFGGGLVHNEYTVPYPLYNVVPERGYPAELGTNVGSGQPIFIYASVVRDGSGYRLRVATPGSLRANAQEPQEIRVSVFGDPGAADGTGSNAAFVTNPTSCTTKPLGVNAYVTGWEGGEAATEATAYPEIAGCGLLQGEAAFDPSLMVEPETTQADTPSGYAVDLRFPQAPDAFGALATPDLKDAAITLPAGLSVSPSAASGPSALAGCAASGGEGINLGSSDVLPSGEDVGDPGATELGAGHPGGDGSPYDDGLYHAAPGRCPGGSRIGEVEVKSPVLSEALHGHLYLAQPVCGQAGRAACSEVEAEEGKVFGVYLEVSGSGVVVKQPGSIEVGGYGPHSVTAGLAPGQIRVRFDEDPQFPVEEVRVTFPGGPRAVLANPQTCGTATAVSVLEPWSAPESGPPATPSSSFAVGGCSAAPVFSPGFLAGTVTPSAGVFSPFTLAVSRQDGEQDLSGVSVTLPPGVAGILANVPLCGEPQAQSGACPAGSRVGTVTAAAGAGSDPLWLSGQVYLTGPYKGAPFGLAVVVPAKAGPFDLGDVVVRAAIQVDPHTAQVTVLSDALPQSVDGIPVRLKTVNVSVDRDGFAFNPTNCSQLRVTGTISGDMPDGSPGASVPVSTPFAVAGCAGLPFKPSFKISTQAKTSKKAGASLDVKYTSGAGQANTAKVAVSLPKALPARLTTIQQACTEAVFDANPASCPTGSVIGTATARTPVLANAVTGPVYLVSHGGAAFPNVVAILQGENVTIDLVGSIDIKHGVTSAAFDSVPDAPISVFQMVLPEGSHSGLAANLPGKAKGSMCGQNLTMPTVITGQNGAVIKQTTKITVTGCPKAKKKTKVKKHKAAKRKGGKK